MFAGSAALWRGTGGSEVVPLGDPSMYARLTMTTAFLSLLIAGAPALAQHEHQGDQSKHHEETAAPAKSGDRVGDPYPLDTCPISGKKLGAMGDPVVKVYDGREVRFCCPACPEKFEKDQAANFAKIDEKIIKDQGLLYPLKTSVVTGKDLPAHPYEFVYGNRLIRLGAESEKADFLKEPKKYLADLDKAVIEQQGTHYPLKTCPVSKDELGGDMGKPVDMVVGGRLIRLCCKDCKKDLEKEPTKFIAMVDAARKGEHDAKPDHDDGDHGGHKHDK
jgi:YHS domain-containing protein